MTTALQETSLGTSWHSYPSIFNMGHRAISQLLDRDVLVEEKVDGSQFSFGYFPGTDHELRIRSKGAEQHIEAPEGMFKLAAKTVRQLHAAGLLRPGFTYRGEYLAKPKHNALAYDRTPKDNIIIFDINVGDEVYLPYEMKKLEAERLGLEVVPRLFEGRITSVEDFRTMLATVSVLGGQLIEGVVVKPVGYEFFGKDKKVLLGKFVSESFREVHKQEWRKDNPTTGDSIAMLAGRYATPARWQKAVQHLREAGTITGDSVRDIGPCIKEIPLDIERECKEEIKDALWKAFWPEIQRRVKAGFPEWYKERLLKAQFDEPAEPTEKHTCDESCRGCPPCYVRTGETVCDKLCEHKEVDEEPVPHQPRSVSPMFPPPGRLDLEDALDRQNDRDNLARGTVIIPDGSIG